MNDRLLPAFMVALVALIAGLWVSIACVPPGHAYVLYGGSRWDHPPTHTDDAMLTAAIAQWATVSGFKDGGVSAVPDITLSYADFGTSIGGYASFSQANGHIIHADIVINTRFRTALVVYVHELGHSIGIAHSCEQGQQGCELLWKQAVMNWDGGLSGLNIDDTAAARALYGPPPLSVRHEVRLAMVSGGAG